MAMTAAELRAVYSVDEGPLEKSIGGIGSKLAGLAASIGAAGILGTAFADSLDGERLADRTAAALALTGPQAETAGAVAGRLFAGAYTDNMADANLAVEAVMSSISGMRDASAADIEAVSGAALNMASVFGVDVQRSAQIAGQMITTGLAANGMEAIDLLVASMSQVPAAVREDILDATDEYGQFFSQLGYSGREAMALLVDASAQGAFGIDKTGDAIKELTIRATDGSTATVAAYDAIGLGADAMADRILQGGTEARNATQAIIDGLLNIQDPAAQSQAAIALFGTPLEDLSTGQIPDFLSQLSMASGELENVAGSAERMGEQLNDNATARFQAFKQAAQQALVGYIGNEVIPRLESLGNWVMQNGDQISQWAQIIGIVLLPVLALWGTAATVNAAKNVAAWVTTALASGTSAATQSLSAGQVALAWVVAGTQSLIQGARMAAAWVLAMGPVGWVIAIVVGLVALIVANWDTVVAWTTSAWNTVTGVVSGAWEWIKSAASTGAQWVVDRIAWFGELPGRVSGWFGGVKDAAVNRLAELVSWLTGLPGQVLGALGDFGSLLYNAGRDLLRGLWNGISSMGSWLWDRISGWASDLLGNVGDFFGIASPSKKFAQIGRYLMQGMAVGIDDEADSAVRAAMAAASAVAVAGSSNVTPAALAALGNQQAQSSLMGAPGGPLLAVDTIQLVEGTPDDVAQKLAVEMRTRGGS